MFVPLSFLLLIRCFFFSLVGESLFSGDDVLLFPCFVHPTSPTNSALFFKPPLLPRCRPFTRPAAHDDLDPARRHRDEVRAVRRHDALGRQDTRRSHRVGWVGRFRCGVRWREDREGCLARVSGRFVRVVGWKKVSYSCVFHRVWW